MRIHAAPACADILQQLTEVIPDTPKGETPIHLRSNTFNKIVVVMAWGNGPKAVVGCGIVVPYKLQQCMGVVHLYTLHYANSSVFFYARLLP